MRIVYITDALAIYGGLERILIEKVNLLTNYFGYDIHMMTLNQGDHSIPYKLDPKVHFCDLGIQFHKQYRFSGVRRFWEIFRLYNLFEHRLQDKIKEIDPDIIICVRLQFLKTINKVKGSIPLLYESHTYRKAPDFEELNLISKIKAYLYRRLEKLPQKVVTITEGDAEDWMNTNPNVVVIPNVVNLNRSGIYSDCRSKAVIFVGRFSRQKDTRSLIQIWEKIYKLHPDWSLHIYGGYGCEQERTLKQIDEMGANITVHDPTPDIHNMYMKNSILLMTSIYEPFGLVLPEAMSCGLPVVAFDCPYGPADIITDGVDGFLIKDRNIDEYVNKVCLLMDDVSLRLKMGQAGIVSSQRYTAERIMPMWKQLFEQVVEQNKK